MKILTTCLLALLMESFALGATLSNEWFHAELTPQQRDALVQKSLKAPFEEMLPLMLEARVKLRPMMLGYNPPGQTAWNDPGVPDPYRKFMMAEYVWFKHTYGEGNPRKGEVLLELFEETDSSEARRLLFDAMAYAHWIPEMEEPLARFARDKSNPVVRRRQALSTLLNMCDVNKYTPEAIAIIPEHKTDRLKIHAFQALFNLGHDLFKLNEENRRALLNIGFDFMNGLPAGDVHSSYFLARRLGYILRIENEFAPDQFAEKYQSPTGLKENFFSDTVSNAKAWYRENHAKIAPLK